MSFLHSLGVVPFVLLSVWVLKEISDILQERRLVLFDNAQVVAFKAMHPCTPLLLRMQGIGTDDASFH